MKGTDPRRGKQQISRFSNFSLNARNYHGSGIMSKEELLACDKEAGVVVGLRLAKRAATATNKAAVGGCHYHPCYLPQNSGGREHVPVHSPHTQMIPWGYMTSLEGGCHWGAASRLFLLGLGMSNLPSPCLETDTARTFLALILEDRVPVSSFYLLLLHGTFLPANTEHGDRRSPPLALAFWKIHC